MKHRPPTPRVERWGEWFVDPRSTTHEIIFGNGWWTVNNVQPYEAEAYWGDKSIDPNEAVDLNGSLHIVVHDARKS